MRLAYPRAKHVVHLQARGAMGARYPTVHNVSAELKHALRVYLAAGQQSTIIERLTVARYQLIKNEPVALKSM